MEDKTGSKPPDSEQAEILKETEDAFVARINYNYPDPEPAVFANHLVVQHDPHEFIVSFYQLIPPTAGPGPESMKRQIERAGGISARCVAKVAISKDRMPSFVTALAASVERHQSKTKELLAEKPSSQQQDSHTEKA